MTIFILFIISPAASTDGDVPQLAAMCPVAAASLTVVARLSGVVVVVVTKLSVDGVASRTL